MADGDLREVFAGVMRQKTLPEYPAESIALSGVTEDDITALEWVIHQKRSVMNEKILTLYYVRAFVTVEWGRVGMHGLEGKVAKLHR